MLLDTPAPAIDPLDELLARHDGTVADEELSALPDKLRLPLVLRYLAGKSNTETAEELGISVAALEGRLKRGKQQLRVRLLRRGVTLVAIVAVLKSSRVVAGEVPGELLTSTLELAMTGGTATTLALASEPTSSTHFALQELGTMNAAVLSKPLVASIALAGVLATVVTTQVAFSQAGGGAPAANPFQLDAVATTASDTSEAEATIDPASDSEATDASKANPFNFAGESSGTKPKPVPASTNNSKSAEAADAPGKIPGIVDLKSRSKSEIAIEKALVQPLNNVGLEFDGAPLSEVVDFLRTDYNIPILLDLKSLDDLGLSPDDPISVELRDISLEAALNILLAQSGLTYVIENEVLLIVSEESAAGRMEVRLYPTPNIAGIAIESFTTVVAPESWRVGGGSGGRGAITIFGDRTAVLQTYQVHREINKLLSQLNDQHSTVEKSDVEMGAFDVPKTQIEVNPPAAR